jgi:hypothetical protein
LETLRLALCRFNKVIPFPQPSAYWFSASYVEEKETEEEGGDHPHQLCELDEMPRAGEAHVHFVSGIDLSARFEAKSAHQAEIGRGFRE